MLYRGEMTPHLFILRASGPLGPCAAREGSLQRPLRQSRGACLPLRETTSLPARWSSTYSNSLM